MRSRLLIAVGLALVSTGTSQAQAQYNFAGQTAGTTYVSFTPAVTLTGQATYTAAGGGTDQTYELDFDQDGRADLGVWAAGTVGAAGRYPMHSARILARHTDMEFYIAGASGIGPVPVGLASGDTLQPTMHRRNTTGALGMWANGSTTHNGVVYYDPFALSLVAFGAMGAYSGGDWLDLQEHYVGFRLRANATTPWRYGWLRLQVGSTANPVTITLKSYALASTPLGLPSARAAGWQLYPTPAAEWLTLVPPAAAQPSYLTLSDLCGRVLLHTSLTGSQQAVSLRALTPGLYVVQIDTPTGRLTQRIVKE